MFEILATTIQQCSHVAVPDASEEAMRYYHSGNILWTVRLLWSLFIPALFLFTGFSGTLQKFSTRFGKNWFFTIVIYLVFYTAIYFIISFPLAIYGNFLREHAYGLSTQSLGRWLENYGKGIGISIASALAFIWIFYLLLKKSPKKWWFYSSLVSICLIFLTMFIQPIWIDPLFNEFGPMQDKKLEKQILDLAGRAGIANSRIFEVDKSSDTNTVNAYVIGFGSSSRIVLWDTTMKTLTPDEILFVTGHEMGHYVLHHIWWHLLYFSCLSFAVFYLTYKAAQLLMNRYSVRFGFKDLHNIASFPLLLLLLNFFFFLFLPLTNYVSRIMEHNADRFGLEITQNNKAAAEAFIVLQNSNLANPRPGPIYKFWRQSHPALGERIEFCNSYCPWEENRPLKYGKHFTRN